MRIREMRPQILYKLVIMIHGCFCLISSDGSFAVESAPSWQLGDVCTLHVKQFKNTSLHRNLLNLVVLHNLPARHVFTIWNSDSSWIVRPIFSFFEKCSVNVVILPENLQKIGTAHDYLATRASHITFADRSWINSLYILVATSCDSLGASVWLGHVVYVHFVNCPQLDGVSQLCLILKFEVFKFANPKNFRLLKFLH